MREIYRGAMYLSAAAAIWGGTYVASKYVLDIIPPFTLLFIRYLITSVVLVMVCWRQNIPVVPRRDKGLLFQVGFVGYFLSISAQFIGTKLSSAHMGAVITTLSPMFQSLFAIWLLKEKISTVQAAASVIAFSGVMAIIILPGGGPDEASSLAGSMVLLLAALFWGYYSVISRKASVNVSSLQMTTWGILLATGFSFVAAFSEMSAWNLNLLLSWQIVFSLLYLSVIGTAVAFFSWNKGLALVPSHQAAIFFFFQPVVGSLLGWALLDEKITGSFFLGTVLIIGGVYLSMRQPAKV